MAFTTDKIGDEIAAAATTLGAMLERDDALPAHWGMDMAKLHQALQGWAERLPRAEDDIRVRAVLDPEHQPASVRMARQMQALLAIIQGDVGDMSASQKLALRTLHLHLDELLEQVEALEGRTAPPTLRELPANVVPMRQRLRAWPPGGGTAA